jgi:hypothetical protein
LPIEWRTTKDQKPFLIYDNGPTASKRMLVFASEEGLELLAQSHRWLMDGTFDSCPSIFDQLYVIRAPLGETSVPCVYALLAGRTQAIYEELFRALSNVCEMIDVSLDPVTIIVDFEKVFII